MSSQTADVVICGAGIAGISAAYHLSVTQGVGNVLVVDERAPLSLTSDKSTECYRNWWPGPGDAMVRLMNRSIDLLERWADASGNAFNLNRRGYLFATADPTTAENYAAVGREISALGAGPLRVHQAEAGDPAYQASPAQGYRDQPTGADLILDRGMILDQFPFLNPETLAVLHARRCGWFSAQQLGMHLLDQARTAGVRLMRGRVESAEVEGGRLAAVRVSHSGGQDRVSTDAFVVAAGPKVNRVAAMLGLNLPIHCELHAKVAFADRRELVPRHAPLLIWSDPVRLPWTPEERRSLLRDPETKWLVESLPAGVHGRPEGPADSPMVLVLWTYDTRPVNPVFPPQFDKRQHPEVALRGFAVMIPDLRAYFDHVPRPVVDGGYYAKTQENRPLVGPLPVEGSYIIGALSGFGLMASPAAGELLAAHVTGDSLPDYAAWFQLSRYQDPVYLELLNNWESSGQL